MGSRLGSELKPAIIEYCRSRPEDCAEPHRLHETWAYLEAFAQHFEGRGEFSTIDKFLQHLPKTHEGNELNEHGKMALAVKLAGYERSERDFGDSHWYTLLFRLAEHQRAIGQKLRVITFNYDRSFEYLGSRFFKNDAFYEIVDIQHVYGQLLLLPNWPDAYQEYRDCPCVPYGDVRAWLGWKAREMIQTVNLGNPPRARIERCVRWITESTYRIVVGFGFDKDNVTLLRLNELGSSEYLFSSAYGMNPQSRQSVRQIIKAPVHFGSADSDAYRFIGALLPEVIKGAPVEQLYSQLEVEIGRSNHNE
jgi:hypothetical protein